MKNRRKKLSFFLLLVSSLLLLVAACARETLYNQLTQEDANQVMVLLQKNGIEASLEQEVVQNETFWVVKVGQQDLAKARELVVASHVISPRAPGLKEVYQTAKGGWIKTPAEERARYLLALKGEIINSLKKLPNVIEVDAVINIPQEDDFGMKEKKRPTASVVIKAQPPQAGESSLSEVQIQQFVANSIEGMSPRDVSVLLNFVAPVGTRVRPGETVLLPKTPGEKKTPEVKADVQLMGLKLDTSSKDRLKVYLIIFFAVLVILSAALILSILQLSRTRQELKGLKTGAKPALKGGQAGSPQLTAPEGEGEEAVAEEEEEG